MENIPGIFFLFCAMLRVFTSGDIIRSVGTGLGVERWS